MVFTRSTHESSSSSARDTLWTSSITSSRTIGPAGSSCGTCGTPRCVVCASGCSSTTSIRWVRTRYSRVWLRFAVSLADFGRLNHRMHNKLFIADSAVAVMGGRNIADEYFARGATSNFVDMDVVVVGEVVEDLARI